MDDAQYNYLQVAAQSGLIGCLTQMTSDLSSGDRLEIAEQAGQLIDQARDLHKYKPNCEESRVLREMAEVTYGVLVDLASK